MQKTKVRLGISRSSNDVVSIEISDSYSSNLIVRAELSLADYARVITGLHGVKALATVNPDCKPARKRVVERVSMLTDGVFQKETLAAMVQQHFAKYYDSNVFELVSDGTGTQQSTHGVHFYTVARYGPVIDNPTLEDC